MIHISEIVTEYLETEDTDFALLINGKWGSGKTYYIKKVLMESLKKTKPIYISLNGLTSLDNISTKILISYFNISENINLGHDTIKSLLEIGDSLKYVSEAKKIFSGFGNLFKNIVSKKINLSDSVIFIDDLERISSSINLIDVLGYINVNYIEHNKYKVILICNEEKIEKKNGTDKEQTEEEIRYSQVKEKIINRSIEFHQNIEEFIPKYLENRYLKQNNSYYDYLKKNQNSIIELFVGAKEENIRTFNFIFDSFFNLYKLINLNKYEKYLDNLLLFIILISIEFKKGNLNSSESFDYKGLDNIERNISNINIERSIDERHAKEITVEKKYYFEEFHKNYLKKSYINWIFFESVFKYILTGYILKSDINNELQKIEDSLTKEWDIALNKLYSYRELEISELEDVIKIIQKNINECNYNLYDYPSIFSFISFIYKNNIINFNFDEFTNDYNSSLKKIKNYPAKIPHSIRLMSLDFSDTSLNPEVQAIINQIKIITKDNEEKIFIEKLNSFFSSLNESSSIKFIESYRDISHHDLFENIYKYDFTEKILKLKNIGINRLSSVLQDLFISTSNAGQVFYNQKQYLLDISQIIKGKLKENQIDQMKNYLLMNLSTEMENSAIHLENSK